MTSASLDVGEGTAIVVAVRTLALSRERVTKETFLRRAVQALVPGSDVGVHLANAIATGVESALVIRVFIDVFDHIDLSAIWPILTNSPKGRPDSRTVRELPEISDHESAVVRSLAGYADRSPVAARGNVCRVVDLQDCGAIRLDVGKVLGVFLGFVDHVSVSWVGLGEEIPSVEEGLALVLILQLVAGRPSDLVVML
jgi:hypothetical protein